MVTLTTKEPSLFQEQEHLGLTLDKGIDLKNRRIYLSSDIDEQISSNIIKALLYFYESDNSKHIQMVLNSYGGEMDEMFAIYDVMQLVECPILTLSVGKSQSACVLISAAGERGLRFATPLTMFMFHPSYSEGIELIDTKTIHDKELDLERHKIEDDLWHRLLAENSSKTKAFWDKASKKNIDTFITAQEALHLGLIDKIITKYSDLTPAIRL